MKSKAGQIRAHLHWAWLVPLILLMTFIVGGRLDVDGLWYDEVFTMRNAGGAGYGPLSPFGIYETIQADDPYQAIGYPMTVALWGSLVGWSEFASRVSSLLFTLIGLALTFRLGKDVTKSSWVGVVSALIFGLSTFTIHYSHELRAFTYVTIFSSMTVWAYWRILTKPSRMAYLWLIIGGIGLLYAHYYAAMLLIALAIYHLLFAPKNRQWFYVPLAGLIIGLAFIPQIPTFMEGFTRFDPANVEKTPMPMMEVVNSLLYYISNGWGWLVAILMLIGVVMLFIRQSQVKIVIGIAVLGTLVLIISNELLSILEPTRLRYAIFLWSLYAVWIASALYFIMQMITERFGGVFLARAIAVSLPVLWLGNALIANYTLGFNASIEGTETPRMRTITNVLREDGASGDLFAFYNGTSQQAWYIQDTLTYSVSTIPMPTMTTASLYDQNESTRQWADEQISSRNRIWYGANRTFGLNQVHDDFLALMAEEFVLCQISVMNDDLSLELYARSDAFCEANEPIMTFDGFTLTGYELDVIESNLSLQLGWQLASDVPPETYSLAVHILSGDNPEPVLQTDIGFGFDSFLPMSINLDISDLATDEYQLALIVYEWRTANRLVGENLATSMTGERLTLTTFQR